MLAYILLFVGAAARLFVHVPNFSPVLAIALFSGVYINRKYALILPVALMALTDLFLGGHPTMFFTWGAILVIAAMGIWVRNRKSAGVVLLGSLGAAVFFYLVTNFGVWLMTGMYAKTFAGLMDCYVMGIPFFRTSVVSTLIYAAVLFGVYEYAALKLKSTKFAGVV
ncbi:MAG: hypothetical protein HQL23_07215 [Candidatus Omnitrophica bacterium]|nr:hypothetical protein [Candidatus Omnitrophota bacterium]